MYSINQKIGKIIRIDGINIIIEITERDIASKLSIKSGTVDFAVSINKLVFSNLPNNKKIVGKITKIYDKSIFEKDTIFSNSLEKFLIEIELVGIYDEFIERFDSGINTFPIIGSDVFSVNNNIKNAVININTKYKLEIGKRYDDSNISICTNPDVLFGKHLGIFGNTGTGKTCTIASLIQGLKRRLSSEGEIIISRPKIIIFDSNNEYSKAFIESEFKVKIIEKEDLKLPHYYLSYTEYYKFLNASQGVQMPVLKSVIQELKGNGESFKFSDLPTKIQIFINNKGVNDYGKNQWQNYTNTMINRIEKIIEDKRLMDVIETDINTVKEIIESNDEIILIQSDFDKDELDIIMFLFSKILYKWSVENRNKKNILLLFEEAHRYINEEDKEDYKLGNYYIERLAREGRKFGISLIISSQRPSEISQTVISQCNSFIVHRITNKRDLDLINKIISSNNQSILSMVSGLEKQYAIIIGEAFGYSDIIKIFDAFPTPESDDPKVIDNWIIWI